ncbi:MAG: response regulator transcription factor [Flavobacteriaceae bacterium]|nr:response regulator transcription factor [Flavobacteriaceae bacterium]
MNILIIEDEARAANQLQRLMRDIGLDYTLLDILDSVEDSIQWFTENTAPELVFMDIQLADGLSFEIFQKVTIECPIIFTTAFDQYALKAFKVNSVDYLLKPIQVGDLSQAVEKFKKTGRSTQVDRTVLERLFQDLQAPKQREGILVKDGDGFAQIKIADLNYVYSEDSITFGILDGKRVIIDETIDELEATLDPTKFFRINRGQVVAKSAIEKIDKYFNHRLKLTLRQGREREFIVSRPKSNDFKDWLNR